MVLVVSEDQGEGQGILDQLENLAKLVHRDPRGKREQKGLMQKMVMKVQ